MIRFIATAGFNKDATVFLIAEEQINSKTYGITDASLKKEVDAIVAAKLFSGANEEMFPLLYKKNLVLLVGVGKLKDLSLTALRITVRKALLSGFLKKMRTLEIIPCDKSAPVAKATIEGVLIGTYVWKKYLGKEKGDPSVKDKEVYLVSQKGKEVEEAVEICEGVSLTRDLINDNADIVTSDFLEATIKNLAKGKKNVSLEILNKKELAAKGLHLHLAVNKGSTKEPKLIIVQYQGAGPNEPYTAIVGKGITFDTGGLNLKPTGSIETMRCDMSGAAATIGTLKNTLALGLKRNVIFAVAVAENAIGSDSFKPGDVFRGYGGKTVEIGNTDAEGRLVLADAIAYVVKNYKPREIIDIATLTGACVIALGYDYTGLVSNDDALAKKLVQASNETDDRVWRLPSYPEIKGYIKSKIADIKNTGLPKGAAGACTAAEFLRQFVGDTKWAHLDIAGTAYADNGRFYYSVGATGAGVRLLTEFLRNS